MGRQDRARRGQAMVLMALIMVVLGGIAAVSVDVGMVASKQHLLHNAASTAALDARQLLADHASAVAPTNAMIWNSITASLADAGLSVRNATGTAAPVDPCAAGYTGNQVALTANYLNGQNVPITDTTTGSPVTITATSPISVPNGAAGVQIGLGACQAAAFGGVIGHPRYTIEVDPGAGQPRIPATNTPGPTETPYPTDTPTMPAPTSTPTTTPTSTATPPPTLCSFTLPATVASNQGFYYAFTTSGTGDITGSWTFTPQAASDQFYVGLYSGTPLGTGTGTSNTDPNTVANKLDLVSAGVVRNNQAQTETLDYMHDKGLQASANTTYTVYFYNSDSQPATNVTATVTYPSTNCPGSPTATPTTSPTSTATVTPPPTATATPALVPYAISAAPDGLCPGPPPSATATPLPIKFQPESEPTGFKKDAKYQNEEYFCPGVYSIGSHVLVYANGVGLGNNYGHDANFKGYIGTTSLWRGLTKNSGSREAISQLFNDEVDNPEPSGGGNNGPSAPCPATIRLPVISRIAHHGNADWFAPLGVVQVTVDNPASCGNPTTGVISGVICDGTLGYPDYIVNLPTPAPPC